MTDQLSAKDWLDQGLRTLASSGFTALKAEPLAKAMGVSRGSFYWHFADIGAFHAAILEHWREVAAEQIIADLEACIGSSRRPAAAAAPGVRRQAARWRTRSAPGPRSTPPRGPPCRRSTGAGSVTWRSCCKASGVPPEVARRPRADSVLGVSRLCAVGQAVAAGETGGDARRIAADGLAMTRTGYSRRSNMLRDRAIQPEPPHDIPARTP